MEGWEVVGVVMYSLGYHAYGATGVYTWEVTYDIFYTVYIPEGFIKISSSPFVSTHIC